MAVHPKRVQRLDIQGIRALAVVLVVLFHAEIPGFGGGYVGVDVFFVISGFLISTHLLESLRDRGAVGFGEFYARRARRLLPAAFTVIPLTVLAAVVWASPLQIDSVVEDAIAATFYVPNLMFAVRLTDYLADTTPSLFMHYWSLGVEEQFYLLWPILLLWLFRRFGLRRRLAVGLAVIGAVSFVLCVATTLFSAPAYAFFLPVTRIWEFGLGSLVAFAVIKHERIAFGRLGASAGWLGLAALVGSGVLFSSATDYPGYAVALPVVGTALLIAAGSVAGGPAALLSIRPLTWIGDISYSMYLVHWPLLVIPLAASGYMRPLPMWVRAAIVVACVPVAWLLYTCVEQPGRRMVWLTAAWPRRTLKATVAAMAVITLAGWLISAAPRPAMDAGRSAPAMTPSPKPEGTAFVPDNLSPDLAAALVERDVPGLEKCHRREADAAVADCMSGSNPGAPLVVLFGDSHAERWHPALAVLADQGLIRLVDHTKNGCPAAEIEVRFYPQCRMWRAAAIATIDALKPALIVSSSRDRLYSSSSADPEGRWRQALTDTLQQFPKESRVALIADTPSTDIAPTLCLGLHLDDARQCALPRARAVYGPGRRVERELAAAGAFTLLDFTDYFCNDTDCPGILGDTLVYQDSNHITPEISARLAPVVDDAVMSILGAAASMSSAPTHG